MDARRAGIETVYQTLAVAPALDIADNLFLGREQRKPGVLGSVFRMLDRKHMRDEAKRYMSELGIATLQNIGQAVETPVRRPAPGRGGGPVGGVRQQGRHPRRADRGARASRRATGCCS